MIFTDPALRVDEGLHMYLFGPGYGESMAFRTATSGWIVVDSLRRAVPGTGNVNPSRALIAADGAPLSCVVLTHPHRDHVTGFAELVSDAIAAKATVASVARFSDVLDEWDTDPVAGEDPAAPAELGQAELARQAIGRAWRKDRSVPWRIRAGDRRAFGDLTLTALWPDDAAEAGWNGKPTTANGISSPFLVEWDDRRILLGADLPAAQWARVDANGHGVPLAAHSGCKVPHHGSAGARADVWAIGEVGRTWALTGWSGNKKLPQLGAGQGAEELLRDVSRMHLTALPFVAATGQGPWTLTPAQAAALRPSPRSDTGWGGPPEDLPHGGPMDGWIKLTFFPGVAPTVVLGDRAGTLVS